MAQGLSFIVVEDANPLYYSIDNDNLPQGGSPAFIIDSNIMVISGAQSIYENNKYRPMGTGISWSINSGNDWNHINQPIDINPDVISVEPFTGLHWRSRLDLAISNNGKTGLYSHKSDAVIEIDECLIAVEKINSLKG